MQESILARGQNQKDSLPGLSQKEEERRQVKRCKVQDPQETWPYTKRCENEHDENAKACEKHLEIFAELGLDPKVLEEL